VDERYAYELAEASSNEQAAPLLCAGIIGYRALRHPPEIRPAISVCPATRVALPGQAAYLTVTGDVPYELAYAQAAMGQ
jgi:D-arabinose 1-dehydrogenase-like Zn-dependent alcohol dehydrogenase